MTVGLFNSSKYLCRKRFCFTWNAKSDFLLFISLLFQYSQALFLRYILRNTIYATNIFLYSVILRFLLLLSGDIELNPGPDSNCSLSVLHLNVRSIRNKLDYIKNLCDFDILCFTETHLTDIVSDNDLTIEGFNIAFHWKDYTAHSSGLYT